MYKKVYSFCKVFILELLFSKFTDYGFVVMYLVYSALSLYHCMSIAD